MVIRQQINNNQRNLLLIIILVGLTALSLANESASWYAQTCEIPLPGTESAIYSLAFDCDGCLWLAHNTGLVRYDGRKSRLFDFVDSGYQSGASAYLFQDIQGQLWLRDAQREFWFFNRKNWEKWSHLTKNHFFKFGLSSPGSSNTLLTRDRQCINLTAKIQPDILPIGQENETEQKIYQITKDSFWFIDKYRVLQGNYNAKKTKRWESDREISVTCLGLNSSLWISDGERIIWIAADQSTEPITINQHWPDSVSCLCHDENNRCLWVGTHGDGLWRLDYDHTVPFRFLPELDSLFITSINCENKNCLWLATSGSGLIRLTRETRSFVSLPEQLPIAPLTVDRQEVFWMARSRELWRKSPKDTSFHIISNDSLLFPRLWLNDPEGRYVLIGDDGIVFIDPQAPNFQKRTWSNESQPAEQIFAGGFDHDGTLWLSREKSLIGFNLHSWKTTCLWPMATCQTSELLILEGKTKWLLRDQHLFYLSETEKPRQINNASFQTGFTSLAGTFQTAYALQELAGPGILSEAHWHPMFYTSQDGVSTYLSGLYQTASGHLWFADTRDFIGLKPDFVLDNDNYHLPPPLLRFPRAITIDSWGIGHLQKPILWWRQNQHLYWTYCESKQIEPTVKVSLDRVYINGQEIIEGSLNALKTKPNDLLLLQFLIPRLTTSSEINVVYRIREKHSDWQELNSSGDRLLLGGLKPGQYDLDTRVNAGDGRWQAIQTQLHLTVQTKSKLWLWVFLTFLLIALPLLATYYKHNKRIRPLFFTTFNKQPAGKYSTSGLNPERAEEIKHLLLNRMIEEKPYLKANLTLRRLADLMGLHYNHLSQVINNNIGQNAKEFINCYRVQAAAQRLNDPNEKRTIVEIAYECGFYSKSVFNSAFKAQYGLTPSQYRKQKMHNH